MTRQVQKSVLLACLTITGCTALVGLDKEFFLEETSTSGGAEASGSSGGADGSNDGVCDPGSVVACYSGPQGTETVGLCQGGTKTCESSGQQFGECSSEVLPTVEDCTTGEDENCDGEAACTGASIFSKSFGDGDEQYGYDVAVDTSGNILVTGYFVSSIDFGDGVLTSAGKADIFVAKLDAELKPVWSRQFGDIVDQYAQAISVDKAGNVILTGYFDGEIDLDGWVLSTAGFNDIFIAKLDSQGKHVWSKRFGDGSGQYGSAIATDGDNNIIAAGNFEGSVTFGGENLMSSDVADAFIAKLDAKGEHVWSRRFGDMKNQYITAIATDAFGNIVIAGSFEGAIDLRGNALIGSGVTNTFVAKFDADGEHLWSHTSGGSGYQDSTGIALDEAGNVTLTGYFTDAISFSQTNPLQSKGATDIFVAQFSGEGEYLWSNSFGDVEAQNAYDVESDGNGNIILVGDFAGDLQVGSSLLESAGTTDIFILKLDVKGQHLWSKRSGDSKDQHGRRVAIDRAGNILLTGYFSGTMDFGKNSISSNGLAADVFVAKLAP